MERVRAKLKETRGGTFFHILVIFLVGMIFLMVTFEFTRVKLVVQNVQSAFERSVRTVAAENYNEIFAGLREGMELGGQFEGGPAGGGTEEEPEWISLHDTGDIEEELIDLLVLKEQNHTLIDVKSHYTLSKITVKVLDGDKSKSGYYEIRGNLIVSVPFSIAGIAGAEVKIPIEVTTRYRKKY